MLRGRRSTMTLFIPLNYFEVINTKNVFCTAKKNVKLGALFLSMRTILSSNHQNHVHWNQQHRCSIVKTQNKTTVDGGIPLYTCRTTFWNNKSPFIDNNFLSGLPWTCLMGFSGGSSPKKVVYVFEVLSVKWHTKKDQTRKRYNNQTWLRWCWDPNEVIRATCLVGIVHFFIPAIKFYPRGKYYYYRNAHHDFPKTWHLDGSN